ncbi:MAG: hypothetical protein ILO42_05785 [Clostridia bacterium]|nr:hypothetical protein [Clostridia bacterium]
MPYVNASVTEKVSPEKEKELGRLLGEAIEIFHGKSEKWLMIKIDDCARITFAGDSEKPAAMIEVMIFGSAKDAEYDRMTARLCDVFGSSLGIPRDRIYVKYGECDRWGWNGMNF